jgi:hypothetical protein
VITTYAQLLRKSDAELVIQQANVFRAEADPETDHPTFINRINLPDPEVVGTLEFWFRAFNEARLNGPRMVAALLLAVPPDQFPATAAHDRESLLQTLERWR